MGKLDNIKITRIPYEPDENSLSEPARRMMLKSVLVDIYKREKEKEAREKTGQVKRKMGTENGDSAQ